MKIKLKRRKFINPNPDIENTMLAQVLNMPRKVIKSLITNKVTTVFMTFLCTSITCTMMRISKSGFGINKKNLLIVFLSIVSTVVIAQEIDWYSIDGGGGVSTNADIQLIGVIGQSDTKRMTGGGISVAGGYLPLKAAVLQDPIFKNGFE